MLLRLMLHPGSAEAPLSVRVCASERRERMEQCIARAEAIRPLQAGWLLVDNNGRFSAGSDFRANQAHGTSERHGALPQTCIPAPCQKLREAPSYSGNASSRNA